MANPAQNSASKAPLVGRGWLKQFTLLLFLCGICAGVRGAGQISPAEVQRRLSKGETFTFIDLRSTALFKNGHIQNAINVPAALIPEKQLPPLGRVIVYDDGLGRDTAAAAADALNQKPGITAEVLAGGFAAWKMSRPETTEASGLKSESLPLITYQELKKKKTEDLILVDMRQQKSPANAKSKAAAPPLTDLAAEFPKARIAQSPFNLPQEKAVASRVETPPLLVLIDNGDGKAQEMGRILKANGNRRFVILVGGETILERKGQPGLQRAGGSMTFQPPPGANPASTNR